MFKFLDQLLTSGHLDSILDDEKNEFSFDLFNLVKREIAKTGEPNKLMSSADVVRIFCHWPKQKLLVMLIFRSF
jgi:hypothetical protein